MSLSFSKLMELAEQGDIEHRTGSVVYRGLTFRTPREFLHFIPSGFKLMSRWSCGELRVVWISAKDRAIFTYCEGDLILEIYDDAEKFRKGLKRTEKYYEELEG